MHGLPVGSMTHSPDDLLSPLAHADYVKELARALVLDAQHAPDLEQEIWLAALSNVSAEVQSPRAWLATVARRFAWRARRSLRRRRDREARAAREEAVPSSEVVLEREELRAEIVRAVLALDEPYRAAIVLRYFEELSPAEAARRLGVPEETLRTRLRRGLAELRMRLRREHGDEFDSWCLLLVDRLRLEPASTLQVAGKACTSVLSGGLAGSGAHAALGGSLALALVILALFTWRRDAPEPQVAFADVPQGPIEASSEPGSARAPREEPTPEASRDALAPEAAGATTAAPVAASVHLRVEWSDGSPAAGVAVRMLQADGSSIPLLRRVRSTDERGDVHFDGLPASTFDLHVDRWSQTTHAWLSPGETFAQVLRLPESREFEGSVRGPDGKPVADARVFVVSSDEGNTAELEVARSAADGSFRIRGLERSPALGLIASAPGFAPSPLIRLEQRGAELQRLDLVLGAAGGSLAGRVLGPDGEPLGGVLVTAGMPQIYTVEALADGNEGIAHTLFATTSDALGRFHVPALALGSCAVWAHPSGFETPSVCGAFSTAEITTAGETQLELRLALAGEVSGRITDALGRGARAVVRLRYERGNSDDSISVETRSDGSFRFGGLAAGEIELSATAAEREEGAWTQMQITAGARSEWNPRLGAGLAIRIRVVRPGHDAELVDAKAAVLRGDRGADERQAHGSEPGRVAFLNCPDRPHRVEIFARDATFTPLAVLEDVRPGASELIVEVDPAREASARIRGRLLDPLGAAVTRARISVSRVDAAGRLEQSWSSENGELDVGPLPPGQWRLRIDDATNLPLLIGPHKLAMGDVWDVGTLQLTRGAGVCVHARRADGGELTGVGQAWLAWDDGRTGTGASFLGDQARLPRVPAGRHLLRVWFDTGELALTWSWVELEDGAQRDVPVVLERGRRVELQWSPLEEATERSAVLFQLRSVGGPIIWTDYVEGTRSPPGRSVLHLPAGRYRVESVNDATLIDEFSVDGASGAPIARRVTYRGR